MRRRALIAVLAGIALISAVPAQGAAKKKTVTLGDNYYMPDTLKVKKGTRSCGAGRGSTRAATSMTSS